MVAPLAVFGLMVDDTVLHFNFAGVQVALVVGGVIPGIPETELHQRKSRDLGGLLAPVGQLQFPHFQRLAERDKVAHLGLDAGMDGGDDGISQPVPAGIFIYRAAHRLPGGRPERAILVIPQVNVTPAGIVGNVVVAVARQPAQARILEERIA